MKLKFAVFALLLLIGGLVWAQLPIQDEFVEENRSRVENRKIEAEEAARDAKELGSEATKFVLADDMPGSTGLKLLRESTTEVAGNDSLRSVSYSVLKSFDDGKPIVTTVVTQEGKKEMRYDFANYSATDPGYIADPFWMRDGEVLVMKAGRYDYYNGYFLYAFDRKNRRLFRIVPDALNNRSLLVSPSRRYMIYILEGGRFGRDTSTAGAEPLSLWVWDAVENKSVLIAKGNDIQGSYSWKSDQELIYSALERRNERMVPVSYIWDAATKKSTEWMTDVQAPVTAPDGKHIVYSTSLDTAKDFSPENSVYVVREVGSERKLLLKRADLASSLKTDKLSGLPIPKL